MTSYKSTINLFFYDVLLYEFRSWSQFSFAFGLDCTPYKIIDSIVLSKISTGTFSNLTPISRARLRLAYSQIITRIIVAPPNVGRHDYVIGSSSISWY